MTGCAGNEKPPPEPPVMTRVESTCVDVADYLFDCPKPAIVDPMTADESDVAKQLELYDAALDDCARRARTARADLAPLTCKGKASFKPAESTGEP